MVNEDKEKQAEVRQEDKTSFIDRARQIRLVKFAIVSTGGFGLTELFVFLSLLVFDLYFSREEILFRFWVFDVYTGHFALLVAIIIVMVYNYAINKIWTFRKQEQIADFRISLQFVRFAIVGASGALVNYGLFHLFFVVIGWNVFLATAIGFVVSVITNFIFNDLWTFNPKFGKEKN
ncbi:MAG: GtrA family protein [Candidatus Heimdallarchaeota archaeon]|nr:GtrA family protein [Candidatus Heimdallarchaeota archaeon]MCK4878588.1 GtrA family protein [Candidatus Heimdallarchaeota archaeon]